MVSEAQFNVISRLKKEILMQFSTSTPLTVFANVDDGFQIVVSKVVATQINLTASNFTTYFLNGSTTYSCYYLMANSNPSLSMFFSPGIYLVEIYYMNINFIGLFEMYSTPFLPFLLDSLTNITQISPNTNISLSNNTFINTNISISPENELVINGVNISIYGDIESFGKVVVEGLNNDRNRFTVFIGSGIIYGNLDIYSTLVISNTTVLEVFGCVNITGSIVVTSGNSKKFHFINVSFIQICQQI